MAILTHEIKFGKEKYHLHKAMQQWCQEKIGHGGWNYPENVTDVNVRWCMDGMFGNTFFYFRDPEDAIAFKLVWA
jgi:hypothetical protein